MKLSTLALAAALACSAGTLLAQQPAAAPAQPADAHAAAKSKAPIYDEKADAAKVIDAAVARAAKNNRRVLLQWGANWCPWCHLLHGTMNTDKDIKRELQYEYDVVLVDVGRFDKNTELAAKYNADLKTGIPYLTVLGSDGKVIVNQETGSLESKEAGKQEHDRAAVMKFLKDHQAAPRVADDVLKDGISRAKSQGKVVFLHFGAPWCPWCHALENWMDRPEIAAVLDKKFVGVKIDTDRDTGGKEVLTRFNPKESGIPWFAFLDADGKVIATSTGPKGNTGFPSEPAEIEHFVSMLKTAGLSAADTDALAASLKTTKPDTH